MKVSPKSIQQLWSVKRGIIVTTVIMLVTIGGLVVQRQSQQAAQQPVTSAKQVRKATSKPSNAPEQATISAAANTQPTTTAPATSKKSVTPAAPTKEKVVAAAPKTAPTAASSGRVSAPPAYKPSYVDTLITSINVTLSPRICMNGNYVYGYNYVLYFNNLNSGGRINTHWEYEYTASIPPADAQPNLPGGPLTNYSIGPGVVSVSDSESTYRGLNAFSLVGYRARLHATSPSDAYSNWVTIDRFSGICS